jgi:hypothetical protein
MMWARHVARMGEDRKLHMFLVGKAEGKSQIGRPRCRWNDAIRMVLGEINWGWI